MPASGEPDTYKAIIKPILSYAAPVWFANASDSAVNSLQVIQNSALRIITGSAKIAPWENLHQEMRHLPNCKLLALLSTQYLASALCPGHPSHTIVRSPSGTRTICNTLQSCFLQLFLTADGSLPASDYAEVLRFLLQSAVVEAVSTMHQPICHRGPCWGEQGPRCH